MGQLVDGPLTWPLYARKIIDWIVGDDRVWEGGFPLPIFPATETSVSDMYLTIKIDPTQVDAMALLQAHVTTNYSPTGIIQINAGIVSATLRAFGSIIFNAIGNGVGSLGPYQYDISAISAPNGYIWKAETGMIVFQQNVTQTNVAGTPRMVRRLRPRGHSMRGTIFGTRLLRLESRVDGFASHLVHLGRGARTG